MFILSEKSGDKEERMQCKPSICWDCSKARALLCHFHNKSISLEERLAFPTKVSTRYILDANRKMKIPLYAVEECKDFEPSRDYLKNKEKHLQKTQESEPKSEPEPVTTIQIPEPEHHKKPNSRKPTVTTIKQTPLKYCVICGEVIRKGDVCKSPTCKVFARNIKKLEATRT